MKKIIIACDPGQTGALAVLHDGLVTALFDMPTVPRLTGKGQQVDPYALATWLFKQSSKHDTKILIEAVSAMPNQGVTSMFRFGESVGILLGICGALQLPVQWIRPGIWKRKAGLIKKPKDASRTLAIQLHPEVADQLTRKKDSGRSDAICIAHFCGQ